MALHSSGRVLLLQKPSWPAYPLIPKSKGRDYQVVDMCHSPTAKRRTAYLLFVHKFLLRRSYSSLSACILNQQSVFAPLNLIHPNIPSLSTTGNHSSLSMTDLNAGGQQCVGTIHWSEDLRSWENTSAALLWLCLHPLIKAFLHKSKLVVVQPQSPCPWTWIDFMSTYPNRPHGSFFSAIIRDRIATKSFWTCLRRYYGL